MLIETKHCILDVSDNHLEVLVFLKSVEVDFGDVGVELLDKFH